MNRAPAYTTRFRSLDNTLWEIQIVIDGFVGEPLEISLEGDEPCVIEWQETSKTDVVQSATCTLRVSNESDRQMAQLMSHPAAGIIVSRNGAAYWYGLLDDAVYEEPYSFVKNYVTELTFSDFGILNRIPFGLTGKQSLKAVVDHCIDPLPLSYLPQHLLTSLTDPKTNRPVTLGSIYINADRFEADDTSWDAMTTRREVLEETLRPLGLRIMQRNGQVYIYDIDYLRDHDETHDYVVWKGTDASLRGSETFGMFEVEFDHGTDATLADGQPDEDKLEWAEGTRFAAFYYDGEANAATDVGFFLDGPAASLGFAAPVSLSPQARFVRLRPWLSNASGLAVAWRIWCHDTATGQQLHLVNNPTAKLVSDTAKVFSVETGYLPIVPDAHRYEMRVNLDFLLSFRPNPFDTPDEDWADPMLWHYHELNWRKMGIQVIMVPVILELVGDNGQTLMHFENAATHDGYWPNTYAHTALVEPVGQRKGEWAEGPGAYGQMMLAYYGNLPDPEKDDPYTIADPSDDSSGWDCDPLVKAANWVTNRASVTRSLRLPPVYGDGRTDGEYVPMPPMAGRLRLTVGSGVFVFRPKTYVAANLGSYLNGCYPQINWQMYRNPRITLVRARPKDDGIDTSPIYEREAIDRQDDTLSLTTMAGCWREGLSPAARGLLFDAAGNVIEKFAKNGAIRTLDEHLLKCLEDQNFNAHPVLSGTAELSVQFGARRDTSTAGTFLVTALRQDLHQDTEELAMARIGSVAGLVYEYAWSQHECVLQEVPYAFAWSQQMCVQEAPYAFAWYMQVCVKQYIYQLTWQEMDEAVT